MFNGGFKMADQHIMAVWIAVFLLLCSCSTGEIIYHPKDYLLSDYCGRTLDMTQDGNNVVMVQLTKTDVYDPNMDCVMTILTSPESRLSFILVSISLLEYCDDYFDLFGNSTSMFDSIGTRICQKPLFGDPSYDTPGNKGIVRFISDSFFNLGNFQLLVTSFYTANNGSCKSSDFKCKNDKCIDSRHVCNQMNNCGDNSDEKNTKCDPPPQPGPDEGEFNWKVFTIVASVVPSVVVVLVIVIVSCVLIHKKKKGMVGIGRARASQTGYPKVNYPVNPYFPSQGYAGAQTTVPNSTEKVAYTSSGDTGYAAINSGFTYNTSSPVQERL